MQRLSQYGIVGARILIAIVFLLNALGVIDQSIPAQDMAQRGVPPALVPLLMVGGRGLELFGGLGLIFGVFPRLAALALFAFLVPATLVAHSFWLAAGTPALMGQLINFSKNLAMRGGLLFVASTGNEPNVKPGTVRSVRRERTNNK